MTTIISHDLFNRFYVHYLNSYWNYINSASGASAMSRLRTGIRKKTITKVAPSPRKKNSRKIPCEEENHNGQGPSSSGPSNIPKSPKPRAASGGAAKNPAAPAKTKRTDFRDPSSLLP